MTKKVPFALHDREMAGGRPIVGGAAAADARMPAVHGFANAEPVWHKVLSGAAESLSDEQLLALILELFLPTPAARAVAGKLLAHFGTLHGIVRAEPHQVRDCIAVPALAVGFLDALRSVADRLARSDVSARPMLDTRQKLLAHLRAGASKETAEHLRGIFLDRRNTLIADEILIRGPVDYGQTYPREIVRRALILDASAVITVHGHAGHRSRPSKAAVAIAVETQRTLEKIGVVLHDHVIMSDNRYTSFRQLCLL